MVTFVTLLLGLVSGTVPIEVATGGPVARVEFLLDGAVVRTISSPPWSGAVAFGDGLAPHELVARTLDGSGMEIARTTQWVNLPRPPAEVDIVLESGLGGDARVARLSWQNVGNHVPIAIRLEIDGMPLILDSERRAALPRYDPGKAHVLEAEISFGTGVVARRQVVFGGEFGTSIETDLTAIPVRLAKGAKAELTPSALRGRFSSSGHALEVAAIEDGAGQVVVVRVPDAQALSQRWVPYDEGLEAPVNAPKAEDLAGGSGGSGGSGRNLHTAMTLGGDTVVRLLAPIARGAGAAAGQGVPFDLFDASRDLSASDGGLLRFLTRSNLSALGARREASTLRVADAVAVAGLLASSGNRRRAVVLVLGDRETDSSHFGAEAARRYLASIRVPLYVWSPAGAKSPMAARWGGVEDVSSLPRLQKAFERLRADLDSQRIVWVEGRHLPQSVALLPAEGSIEQLEPPRPEVPPRASLPALSSPGVVAP